MTVHTSVVRIAFVLLLLGLASSSSAFAAKVNAQHDEQADFSQFETYHWRHVEDLPVSPGLDTDIRSAVDEVLADKGLRLVETGEPTDLQLEYAVGSVDNLQAGGFRLQQGWYGVLYLTPGAYSTVSAGILILATPHEGESAVWAGSIVMRGNTPNALQVMRDKAAKEAKRIAKTYPGSK